MKAQVSFEYILLFSLLLFVFIIGISLFSSILPRTSNEYELAQILSEEVKTKIIVASLSRSNTTMVSQMPASLNGIPYQAYIYPHPENILLIKSDNKQLARIFLPRITNIKGNIEGSALVVSSLFEIHQVNEVLEVCSPSC